MHNILVVDDELSIRESFSLILEGKYRLLLAASGEAALKTVTEQQVDLAYLDIRMPGLNGLETLKRIKQIDPDLEIVMVTAVNDVQKAGEAVRHGARDYVVKPFDVDHIQKLTEQILRKKALLKQGTAVQINAEAAAPELIGQTEKITAISKTIASLPANKRVLIVGEPGTEKETIARLIHAKSSPAGAPFRAVTLSARQSIRQMKALLFGWGKGGSTVDLEAKSGLLEQAKTGSLFIDNLEALPPEILKTLTGQEFLRQGSSTKIPIETRLLGGAAANLPKFSQLTIALPPLKERAFDIPLLINHFAQKYNNLFGKEVKLEAKTIEVLANYTWPGNVKQLENLLERLILCSSGEAISPAQLPVDILLAGAVNTGSGLLNSFEKKYLEAVYTKAGQDKEKAAALLGINPLLLETKL